MKLPAKIFVAAIAAIAALQLVHPGIPSKPTTAEVQAPDDVKKILEKDCYSCHSNQNRLSWFDHVQPGYWLVRHDILTARERLNFSTLGSRPAAAQKAALFEAVNMIELGAMPLPQFTALHPDAKVSPQELATLRAYLAPWPSPADPPAAAANGARLDDRSGNAPAEPLLASLAALHPEGNGLAFDSQFEDWKPISTTERGDNNTFRFILGNDIAIQAIQSGNIHPWPDGARMAKIAWQRTPGADGLLHPGKFVQVELMVKDSRAYRKTDGWGWGRWRGLDLKPYGNGSGFVKECIGCHEPVRGNDFVYTLPITDAETAGQEVVNNRAAVLELPSNVHRNPLGWGAITMMVNPATTETATLFGNDTAVDAARSAARTHRTKVAYPAGSVLALVTWAQRDDPHWFGARIPDSFRYIEFVKVREPGGLDNYQRFKTQGLNEFAAGGSDSEQRMNYILNLAPVQLP